MEETDRSDSVSDVGGGGGATDEEDWGLEGLSERSQVWWSAVLAAVMAVGVCGNALVVAVVVRDRELSRSSTGAFLANLSTADLLLLAVCLPTAVAELSAPPLVWVLPPQLCEY